MDSATLEQLRYPIGKFNRPQNVSDQLLKDWIAILEYLPSKLETLVKDLTPEQLATPYRPEGWTIRQLIHHIADSHHHSYIRFKWALTEEQPVIKPYLEKGWANLFDAKTAPIDLSLNHLKAVHAKLVYLLKGLSRTDLERKFIHPDGKIETPLTINAGHYAWHGSHHYAHIENALKHKGWL